MEWQELLIDGYGRILEALEEALKGMTQDDLNQQPRSDCNSMGWLAWHLTRVQDYYLIEGLAKKEQLWVKDGWYAKFNLPPNPADTGVGYNSEDLAAFKSPDVETQLAYHRAVLERTKRYITSLSASDLDRELNEPWDQPPTIGRALTSILNDNLQHVGQIAYVRGLLKGKGWLGY